MGLSRRAFLGTLSSFVLVGPVAARNIERLPLRVQPLPVHFDLLQGAEALREPLDRLEFYMRVILRMCGAPPDRMEASISSLRSKLTGQQLPPREPELIPVLPRINGPIPQRLPVQ